MSLSPRPANASDIRKFYPEVGCSFRAMVCEVDGVSRGIIGLALMRPGLCMFSSFQDELRPHLKSMTVLRLIKWAETKVKESRVPVFAIAQPDYPTAPGMLERLGFEYWGRYDDDEVYQWRPC